MNQEPLLARWRETRSPRLADLLCCVEVEPGWAERLATLATLVPTRTWAIPRVEALPDDPRTTVFLVKMLETANWPGKNSRELWTIVFERLVALRDVRCIPTLRALIVSPPRFFQPKLTRWATEEIGKVADRLAKLELPKDDARTVKLAEAQDVEVPKGGFFTTPESTASVDALLAQVYAAPDDLELRAVIGDALQQLGDPRGELIALQLAKRPNAKLIGALIDEHRAHLAGALARLVPSGGRFEFEAGFLEAITIGSYWTTIRDREEAAVSPHWATVTTVDFSGIRAQNKWFEAWWSTAKLDRLRRIKIGGFALERESAAVPWQLRFSMRPSPPAEARLVEMVRRIVQA